jgi:hypothetical protein
MSDAAAERRITEQFVLEFSQLRFSFAIDTIAILKNKLKSIEDNNLQYTEDDKKFLDNVFQDIARVIEYSVDRVGGLETSMEPTLASVSQALNVIKGELSHFSRSYIQSLVRTKAYCSTIEKCLTDCKLRSMLN